MEGKMESKQGGSEEGGEGIELTGAGTQS